MNYDKADSKLLLNFYELIEKDRMKNRSPLTSCMKMMKKLGTYYHLLRVELTFQLNEVCPPLTFHWQDPQYESLEHSSKEAIFSMPLVSKDTPFGTLTLTKKPMREPWKAKEKKHFQPYAAFLKEYLLQYQTVMLLKNQLKMEQCYDSVTGLVRYECFLEEAEKLRKKHPNYVLVYSDFSHFKYINDTYGFEKGNELLKDFSEFLNSAKGVKQLSCRVHSDHFISIVFFPPGMKKHDLIQLVEEKNMTFSRQEKQKLLQNKIMIHSGIYICKHKSTPISTSISNANLARKLAKQTNGFCQVYTNKLSYELTKQAEYSRMFQIALQQNEFQVYYQPKVDLQSKKMIGAEALIRWIKADGTAMLPGEFIPVFEKTGEIIALDFFVYQSTCQYLRARLNANQPVVPISMNVSRMHLRNQNLVTFIEQLIKEYEIPPHLLEFELTENLYVEDYQHIRKIMTALKKLGVRVSIDDFGSGYSSLNILTKLHCDVLKLDRAFLDCDHISKKNRLVIEAIHKMAKELGISVICEGVETEKQAKFLESIGCFFIQGYLVAKPLPEKDFSERLTQNHIQKLA